MISSKVEKEATKQGYSEETAAQVFREVQDAYISDETEKMLEV
jgi:chorismate mutase